MQSDQKLGGHEGPPLIKALTSPWPNSISETPGSLLCSSSGTLEKCPAMLKTGQRRAQNSEVGPLLVLPSPTGMCPKGPWKLFPPLTRPPSFPRRLFCWPVPFGNWFCSSVRSCFLVYFISQERKAKGIRRMMAVPVGSTCSEDLTPCPHLPGAVLRLRPWLEEY